MAWFLIFNKADGRLVSQGTVKASSLPPEWDFKELSDKPPDSQMWDEATLSFIDRPPKVLVDRLEDLKDRPGVRAFWNSLTLQQKKTLRDGLVWLLGRRRMRNPNNDPVIE